MSRHKTFDEEHFTYVRRNKISKMKITRLCREKRVQTMDEKEKEALKEASSEMISAEETQTASETTEETVAETFEGTAAEGEALDENAGEAIPTVVTQAEPTEKNKRLRNAAIRAGAAFLVAIILLAGTKFAVIDLIKGAKESEAVQDEELGSFVKTKIPLIVGFFDEEKDASDAGTSTSVTPTDAETKKGEYAIVLMGTKFVTVHFTNRYLESSHAVETQTLNYINGSVVTLDSYVQVEGTTETISEDLSAKMYDWMIQSGFIPDSEDYATYLSDVILEVDTVNGMSEILVYVLTGIAAVCLLYIIVELILMATGVYLNEPKKKKADEENQDSENDEEKNLEDGAESIKSEENSENNGCSETEVTEKSDVQEDK